MPISLNKGFTTAMINVFVAAGVFYVAVVVLMYLLQNNFMYFPPNSKPVTSDHGVTDMEEITIHTADGLDLFAWYKPPSDATKPTIIFFHGNAGSIGVRDYKARLFMDRGYGFLLVEYRGFSTNPGRPDEQGLYEDARAAVAYLNDQGVANADLVIYGESLGTGVATFVAAQANAQSQPFRAVVLEAPFTSTVDVGASHYPFLPVRFLMKDRYASIERIDAIGAPLFILHGDQDWTVPQRLGRKLFATAKEPKDALWIEGAGHNDVYNFGAGPAILEFLARY